MQEYALTGDFGDVGRFAAERRRELVERVAEDLRSGRADVDSVAEYLVDAALARAARCAQGGGGIYEELWALDETRASVAAAPQRPAADSEERTLAKAVAAADIQVDEQPRGGEAPLRPLFRHVAPHVLAQPSALAVLEVFEVFRRRPRDSTSYTEDERRKIEALLDVVDRSPVMRRCRAEAASLRGCPWTDASWRDELWRIWFRQREGGSRCGFEHVFVGEASSDLQGREVVGGLHNWFKFYLEEQRGAARYLGRRYPGRTGDAEAAMNPRFVSGCFTWDLEGRHLVKDVGGFFVGVSAEWQLAVATTAFFETETAERAASRQWSRDFAVRDLGYARTAKLGEHVYRLSVVRGSQGDHLTTFYTSQLGVWDARKRAELDEMLSSAELERRLPDVLVLHGFADEPELLACAARVGAAGALTLREALQRLRSELRYSLESSLAEGGAEIQGVVADRFADVARELVDAHAEGLLTSSRWPDLLQRLQGRLQLSGRRFNRSLRLALTGRLAGHHLRELLQLLELLEAGAPWGNQLVPLDARMAFLRRWLDARGIAAALPREEEVLA